jgi:hypothetical protein
MMSEDELKSLVMNSSQASPALGELKGLLKARISLEHVGLGEMLAGEAKALYEMRRSTVQRAQGHIDGLDEVLEQFNRVEPRARIVLVHLGTTSRLFTVVLDSDSRSLLGCLSTARETACTRS